MEETTTTPQEGNNMMPMIIGAIVIIAIAGGAYYFTQMREPVETVMVEETVTDDSIVAEDTVTDDSMMIEDNADVTFEVNGADFKFSEETLTVKKGDTVKVIFTSEDSMPHDWRLDEFDAATDIVNQGEVTEVTFVASEAGEFEYYCSVGQHRANGMVGTLVVEE